MAIQDSIIDGSQTPVLVSSNRKKTLFIGIGGSGKEVLLRLRRKFYASTGDRYGFDFIRYLWIDTDISMNPVSNEKWAVIGQNIQFGTRDKIDEVLSIYINPKTLDGFYDRVNNYEHIRSWIPTDALRPLGSNALENGARAIRPLGRLAFSWHADTVKNRIQENINALDIQFTTEGISLDDSISIYVVGSLAGGTGSGMFLELAKMIKANWPAYPRYGVFFLSDVFEDIGNNQTRNANCYAALQELDFYQTASNALDPLISAERNMFEFIEPNGQKRSFTLPIYNNVFLVSKEYHKSPGEKDFADPFEMVAEIFYFDFDRSNFGSQKRSQSVNGSITGSTASVKYLWAEGDQEVAVQNTYSSDYSAFGLAGIFLNISKMKNWATYRYILDITQDMTRDNPVNTQVFQKPDGGFRVDGLGFDSIIRAISYGNQGSSVEDTYKSGLENRRKKLFSSLESMISFDHFSINNVQQACADAFRRIDTFFQNEQSSMNGELEEFMGTPGTSLQNLQANLQSTVFGLYQGLELLLYEILGNLESGGPVNARAMFMAVKNLISQMSTQIDQYKSETNRLKDLLQEDTPDHPEIVIDSHINNLLAQIKDSDEIPIIFPFYKTKAKKYFNQKLEREVSIMNRTIRHQIDEYTNQFKQLLCKRYEILYREKLIKLFDMAKNKVLEFVNADRVEIQKTSYPSLSRQLTCFDEQVKSLIRHYEGFESDLRIVLTSTINRKMILDDNDKLDEVYQGFVDHLGGIDWFVASAVAKYGNEIKGKHRSNPDLNISLQEFVRVLVFYEEFCLRDGLPEIKHLLKETCRERFDGFMDDDSVLNRLNQLIRSDEKKYLSLIQSMLSNLSFRLGLTQDYPNIEGRVNSTAENNRITGLPEHDERIERHLSSLGRIGQFKYHRSDESILFYSETFGYPLFALKCIESLEYDFNANLKQEGMNTRYHRYTDIVTDYLRPLVIPRKEEVMRRFMEAWELLYESIILRVVSYKNKNWTVNVAHEENAYAEQEYSLGRTLEAAAYMISNSPSLKKAINEQTYNERVTKYNDDNAIEEIYYAIFGNYNQVLGFLQAQFSQQQRPKIPQEFVLEKLLQQYRSKYKIVTDSKLQDNEIAREFAAKYQNRILARSGYSDAIHTQGISIYPSDD